MRSILRLLFFATLFIFCHAVTSPVCAVPSVSPENTVTIEETTVIRDAKNPYRWYYVPEKPRLLERDPNNKSDPRPAFQLMAYQAEKDDNLYEGGLLQFSVSLKLPEEKQNEILKKLRNKPYADYKTRDLVELAPLPFRMAKATIYDANGKNMAQVPQAPGLAPPYITGALPFQIKLNRFGTDLYSALVDGKSSGIGVLLQLSFEGMLPPAGFKVTVHYDQTWKYLQQNSSLQIQLGTWFVGAKVGVDKSKIREELVQNKCIQIESLTNEAIKDEFIDNYLDPILQRVCSEMFSKIQPPNEIAQAKSDEPNILEKCFLLGSFKIKTEMKDYKIVRKGSETIDFATSVMVERQTACGTFIGINKYPEDVKKTLSSTMPLNSWASAFLMLPNVDNGPELNISAVSMSADVCDKKGNQIQGLSDTASWSSGSPESWKNTDGKNTHSLKFPLMALFDKQDNKIDKIREEYHFRVNVKIEQFLNKKLNTANISYKTPLFNGDLPLADPKNLVENVVFDLSLLDFSAEGLKKASIELFQNGKGGLSFRVGARDEVKTVVFITPSAQEGQPPTILTAQIFFEEAKKGGRRNIEWTNNNKDLSEIEKSLYFLLFDSDWQQ